MTPFGGGGGAGQCVKVLKRSATDYGSTEVSENHPCNPSNPWLTSGKNGRRPRMAQSGRAETKKDLTTDYPERQSSNQKGSDHGLPG